MKFYAGSQISRAYIELADLLETSGGGTSNIVNNEPAIPSEFDGINKTFTFSNTFKPGSTCVYYGTTRQPLDESYTESIDGTSITFLGDAPDPAVATLFWDYIKA